MATRISNLVETITSPDPAIRNRAFAALAGEMEPAALLEACEELEAFRRDSGNLYERVRASLFLHAAHRFFLQDSDAFAASGRIPPEGFGDLLERRFEEALDRFREAARTDGPNGTILSALAETYHHLAFQDLMDQVRRSVRVSRGNQWMFRVGHPEDHPLRMRPEMLRRPEGSLLYPALHEATPVRLDLSHSGWSDIFFLGMDYPEAARVLNISVNLGVYGRDEAARPPVEAWVRAVPEPILRLTSVDLEVTKDITSLDDLFNFGNDYLSLLKAGIIASGLVPPSFEGTGHHLGEVLSRVVGPGMGVELVTRVNDIPKGSRLAVSTNLLACMISALMRATGQTGQLVGGLEEPERRLVASRAILGEWIGGSGGGWQDSGGVWPGFKVIEGRVAVEGDPEWGVSRGRLLPEHRLLTEGDGLHPETPGRLAASLVPFHGGMAQNVGPILEMVTEKYLLRARREWDARHGMRAIFDDILGALADGDIPRLADATSRNFDGPLQDIIPWATNHFTQTVIERVRERAGGDYLGFQMLGGMSGGGMGMYARPERQESFRDLLLDTLVKTKREVEQALPFAMDPVVYLFEVNQRGTWGELMPSDDALMPGKYYSLQIPALVREGGADIGLQRKAEFDDFVGRMEDPRETHAALRTLVGRLFRVSSGATHASKRSWDQDAERIRRENGFDPIAHEQMRDDLRSGAIGLAQNRLAPGTRIEDVEPGDIEDLATIAAEREAEARAIGERALAAGEVAAFTLAAGVGTRWTGGAGVVKAVNPFVRLDDEPGAPHRSFLEIHLAKTRKASRRWGSALAHVVSTSYLTDAAVRKSLELAGNYGVEGELLLSRGASISQRLVPMIRDLEFLWREMSQERLDEQKQKVREAVRAALMEWARATGEASDYTDNLALQRFSPPGHWYEVPSLLLNGTLARLLRAQPSLRTLMLHNIDTLGADLDPLCVGLHRLSDATLTYEVTSRRLADRGGGLARVNGGLRLLEGLAQPNEDDELRLSYYNSNTTWIEIDGLLALLGLSREDVVGGRQDRIADSVRALARRMPTYITIKDVKRRWGHGQEDVFPVAQAEKLWADMTGLGDLACNYLVVSRKRGQQLKSPDELDPWNNDGSREYVRSLGEWA